MKNKDLELRLLFKIEGEIKNFPEKEKLKGVRTTKPVLQEILKVSLTKKKKHRNIVTK